jgi:cytoskeletal protein RodZ
MKSENNDVESKVEATMEPANEPEHVGERLRFAREAMGKSLVDIATQTKVPLRLLEALDRGAVDELPVGPYAAGFARSYARAVGLDENEIAEEVRARSQAQNVGIVSALDHYEPADADRVPPTRLAWTAAVIAVLLVGGYILWRSFSGNLEAPAPATPGATTGTAATATAGATPVAVAAGAPVIVRASAEVWFGLNDATGRLAFERTLKAGESYAITPEQRAFTLRTGRPQSLRLVVGNRELPQLGPDDLLVKNVGLDAAALTARGNAPAPGAAPAPTVAQGDAR